MTEKSYHREPIQVIQLNQPACSLTHGTAPCTASGGKCFNTRKTCQDPENYQGDKLLSWFFIKPEAGRVLETYNPNPPQENQVYVLAQANPQPVVTVHGACIPSLNGSTTTPTEINIAGSDSNVSAFGRRATLTVSFKDHAYSDVLADPYPESRSYDPLERGTFWGKFLARNPYMNRTQVTIHEGYKGQQLSEMISRDYYLEKISDPTNHIVTIVAKDPLHFVDNKRALAPALIDARLAADLDTSTTAVTITGTLSDFTKVIGASAPNFYIRINDEVIKYLSVTDNGGTLTLNSVQRAMLGTKADEHKAEDDVQRVLRWWETKCWAIVKELLVSFGDIAEDLIPYDDWEAEGNKYLPSFSLTATLAEATGVNQLIGELMRDCNFFIWWDERARQIKMQANRPPTTAPKIINDREHIIAKSAKFSTDVNQRLSRVFMYYGEADPTGTEEKSNYVRGLLLINPTEEGINLYGETKTRRIYSRWLSTGAQVFQVANTLLSRYKDNAKELVVKLDAKDRDLWTAGVAEVTTSELQDETGLNPTTNFQVISAQENVSGEQITLKLQVFGFASSGYCVWMRDSAQPWTATPEAERTSGMWLANDSGKLSDNSEGFKWQ